MKKDATQLKKDAIQFPPLLWATMITLLGCLTYLVTYEYGSGELAEIFYMLLLGAPFFLLSAGVGAVEHILFDYFENEILAYVGGAILMFSLAYFCALLSKRWYIRLLLTYALIWWCSYICAWLAFFTIWSNL